MGRVRRAAAAAAAAAATFSISVHHVSYSRNGIASRTNKAHCLTFAVSLYTVQVQSMMGSAYSYRSTWEAARALTSQGGLHGIMRGYWATNAVWLPWNAIYIASYESSKRAAARALNGASVGTVAGRRSVSGGGEAALPAWAVAGCAAASSTLAVTLTHPADVVKTRLQVAFCPPYTCPTVTIACVVGVDRFF